MKAIVNVKSKSLYSKYNGLTYDVQLETLNDRTITLLIDNVEVQFSLNEVIIVDFQKLYETSYIRDDFNRFDILSRYLEINDMEFYYPF